MPKQLDSDTEGLLDELLRAAARLQNALAAQELKAKNDDAATSYLIWSNEHAAWWARGTGGYTQVIEEARRYKREGAEAIVRDANAYLPEEQRTMNEVMVRAPET